MAGACHLDPHRAPFLVEQVEDAAASGDLDLPLGQFAAAVQPGRQVALELEVPGGRLARTWSRIGAHDVPCPAQVVGRGGLQRRPSLDAFVGTESNRPLPVRWRRSDEVAAFRAHGMGTGPKSSPSCRRIVSSSGSAQTSAVCCQAVTTCATGAGFCSDSAPSSAATNSTTKAWTPCFDRNRTQGNAAGMTSVTKLRTRSSCCINARNSLVVADA